MTTRANLRALPGGLDSLSVPAPDIEAEESVLGSMILSASARAEAINLVAAEDFSRDQHRQIFEALISMHGNAVPVDHVTLAAELDNRGLLETVGDRAYLLRLTDTTPNPGNVKNYCALLKESSQRRALYGETVALQIALQSGDYQGLLARLQSSEYEGSSPQKYFDGGLFVPKRLAEDILKRQELRYAGQRLYVWRDGVYRREAEDVVRQEAQRLLGERSNEGRKREAVEFIRTATAVSYPEPDLTFINVLNGRLNWRTGELVSHDPESFEVVQLPVTYKAAANCPAFDHFLETTLDAEVIPLVHELLGYCCIPDTRHEKCFLFTGGGSNGKSVLLDTLTALLGSENVSAVGLQELEENRFAAAALVGKLANVHADLDSRALRSSRMFKALVTGDLLTVERKYVEPFEYRNRARLIFSANSVPLAADKSFAFLRRLVIVPFERTFTGDRADKHLREKLTTPEELSGILNRALAGLLRLDSNQGFTIPVQVHTALEDYHRANDSIAEFVAEKTTLDTEGRVSKEDFRNAYWPWCDDQGYKRMSDRGIKDSLKVAVPGVGEVRLGGKERCWTGMLLDNQG